MNGWIVSRYFAASNLVVAFMIFEDLTITNKSGSIKVLCPKFFEISEPFFKNILLNNTPVAGVSILNISCVALPVKPTL